MAGLIESKEQVDRKIDDLDQTNGSSKGEILGGRSADISFNSFHSYPVLSEDALFGLPGRIVRTLDPHTEADRAAVLIQLLLGVGNLIGRKPFFLAGAVKHHTNLFACIVGKTSKARKGTSWAYIRSLLESVDPNWVRQNLVSGLSSGEGLLWAVRDPLYKPERNSETGEVTDVLFDPAEVSLHIGFGGRFISVASPCVFIFLHLAL
jgi:hypothetical protein